MPRSDAEPFRLTDARLHLSDGDRVERLDVDADFWRKHGGRDGRIVSAFHARTNADVHAHEWEMHPAGDEVLYMLSGALDLFLEEPGGERVVALSPGLAFVVPQGVWHRFEVREPSELFTITRGAGTRRRPV